MIKQIEGGVCAAKGYTAGGIYCGIRKRNDKNDLALIFSKVPAHAAAVYTTNLVKGAPLTVTKQHIADGIAQAVICNSGNANTCNSDGLEIAEKMSALAAEQLGISPRDVIVASTGVIGQKLNITPVADHIGELAAALSPEGEDEAAKAIMTTDLVMKKIAVEFVIDGKVCRLGGHRQRQRHDPSQHGYHAGIPYYRCSHFCPHAAESSESRCAENVQYAQRRRGHLN